MSKFEKIQTPINDLFIIKPTVFGDDRGFFMETYSKEGFKDIGLNMEFVQDNHSKSSKGVLRGLHFQKQFSQGKLVRVISGAVYDVAVDLRRDSCTFAQSFGVKLSAENKLMFYVPEGFAHGFLTLEDNTEFVYKCTNFYRPEFDSGILWCDNDLKIDWKFEEFNISKDEILLSQKDEKLQTFSEFLSSGVVIK